MFLEPIHDYTTLVARCIVLLTVSFCHRVHSCHNAAIIPTVQTSIHRCQRPEGRQENIPRTITPLLPNWSHMTGRVALLLRLMPNPDPSGTEIWTHLTRRCSSSVVLGTVACCYSPSVLRSNDLCVWMLVGHQHHPAAILDFLI